MGSTSFQRITTIALTGKTTGEVWDYALSTDKTTMYIASSNDGIFVVDVTDPEAPTYETKVTFDDTAGTEFDGECTDVIVIGDNLYACGRKIDFTSSNQPGCLAKYDISGANKQSPSWDSSFEPSSMSPRPVTAPGYHNNWYQGMCTDGAYIYLAGQYGGLTVVNPDTMTVIGTFDFDDLADAGALASGTHDGSSGDDFFADSGAAFADYAGKGIINKTQHKTGIIAFNSGTTVVATIRKGGFSSAETWDTQIGDQFVITEPYWWWETSRITYHGGWVFLANHGNGVIALDVSTPATPTNMQWYDSPVISPIAGSGFTTNCQLRVRAVEARGGYLYAAPNSNDNAESGNRPERGLMVMDISDPTAVDVDDWVVSSVGINANDTEWDSAEQGGDRPFMNLSVCKNRAYIPIGQRGTGVWDISDPANPVFQGLQGTGIEAGTNLYQSFVWEDDGAKQYAYYSDGFSDIDNDLLYVDRVHPEGIKMFTIGNHGSTQATDTAFVLNDRAGSHDMSKSYTAVAGDVVEKFTIRVKDSSDAKNWVVCLYEVSGGVPTNIVPGSTTAIPNSNTTGTAIRTLESAAVSIGLNAGVEYCVVLSCTTAGGGNPTVMHDSGAVSPGRRDSTVVAGVFNNPFVNSTAFKDAAVSAVGRNMSGLGSSGVLGSILGRVRR